MSQQFCLKWNNHMNNMMDVFKNLLSTESMVDVTLACDGLSLKAHKMVLSACSPFFQSLFLENPCKHPIVILKDMKYTELKAIIEFMYHGEVNVAQEQLSALMKTAETLRVKGLAEMPNEKNSSSSAQEEPSHRSVPRTETPPPSKRRRGRVRKRSLSDSNRSDDSNDPKIKQPHSPDIEELSGDVTMDNTSGQFSNLQSQVPMQSLPSHTNSYQKSSVVTQDPQIEEPASADESEFGVEPAKLLEQTLTTDDLQNRRSRTTMSSGMEMQRRPRSSTDHSSNLVPTSMSSDTSLSANQQPESPPDIKPELLELDPPMSPVAGPSHSTDNSMMMYMDQSSVSSHPGTSFQDNTALVPQDSQPQGFHLPSFENAIFKSFLYSEDITESPENNPNKFLLPVGVRKRNRKRKKLDDGVPKNSTNLYSQEYSERISTLQQLMKDEKDMKIAFTYEKLRKEQPVLLDGDILQEKIAEYQRLLQEARNEYKMKNVMCINLQLANTLQRIVKSKGACAQNRFTDSQKRCTEDLLKRKKELDRSISAKRKEIAKTDQDVLKLEKGVSANQVRRTRSISSKLDNLEELERLKENSKKVRERVHLLSNIIQSLIPHAGRQEDSDLMELIAECGKVSECQLDNLDDINALLTGVCSINL